MRFNIFGRTLPFIALAGLAAACTSNSDVPATRDRNNIGEKLDAISVVSTTNGAAQDHVTVFDPTIRMIHQFHLGTLTYERTLPVREPEAAHFLLYGRTANYVIDLTKKHLTIFNRAGVAQNDPIHFQGMPKSAALRPDIGASADHLETFLAVYDDVGSVGLLILDAEGNVTSKTVLGPVIDKSAGASDVTIAAGDILEDGRLILSLSDDRLAVIDFRASVAQGKWVTSAIFPSTLSNIDWIAPVGGQPNRIFVSTKDRVALLDLGAQSVIDSYDTSSGTVVQFSKSVDPHVVIFTKTPGEVQVIYLSGSTIRNQAFKTKFISKTNILTSMLDATHDSLTMIVAPRMTSLNLDEDPIDQASGRQLLRFRFSDQLATASKDLPDAARVRLTRTSVFALFPSDLGSAAIYSIDDEAQSEQHGFNRPFIH